MSIATIIAFAIRHRKWLAYAAAAFAVLLALWWLVSALVDHGRSLERAEWEERQRAAEAKAAADTALLNEAIAEIDTGVTIDMEAISNVRTIYRDRVRTVAVEVYRDRGCDLPGGVLGDINAAAQGYAAAAAGDRSPAVRPAQPAQ